MKNYLQPLPEFGQRIVFFFITSDVNVDWQESQAQLEIREMLPISSCKGVWILREVVDGAKHVPVWRVIYFEKKLRTTTFSKCLQFCNICWCNCFSFASFNWFFCFFYAAIVFYCYILFFCFFPDSSLAMFFCVVVVFDFLTWSPNVEYFLAQSKLFNSLTGRQPTHISCITLRLTWMKVR